MVCFFSLDPLQQLAVLALYPVFVFGFAVITDKVDLGNLMLLQLSSYRHLGRNFSVCDKVVSSGLVHISDVVLRRSTFFSPW